MKTLDELLKGLQALDLWGTAHEMKKYPNRASDVPIYNDDRNAELDDEEIDDRATTMLWEWDQYYKATMPKMRAVRKLMRSKMGQFTEQGFVSARDRRKMEWVLEQLDVTQAEVHEMFRCAMALEANAIPYGGNGYDPTPQAYYDDGDFVWMMSEPLSRYAETER